MAPCVLGGRPAARLPSTNFTPSRLELLKEPRPLPSASGHPKFVIHLIHYLCVVQSLTLLFSFEVYSFDFVNVTGGKGNFLRIGVD